MASVTSPKLIILETITPELNTWVAENGLRIRLFEYKLACLLDFAGSNIDLSEKPKGYCASYDYFEENNDDVLNQLRNSKFIRYSTIIIIINRYCNQNLPERGVDTLLRAVKSNDSLRYKPIILLSLYHHGKNFFPWRLGVTSFLSYDLKIRNRPRPKKDYVIYPKDKDMSQTLTPTFTTVHTLEASGDAADFESVLLPNATMVQIVTNLSVDTISLETLLRSIHYNGSMSVQETFTSHMYDRYLVYAMKNANYYFYALNPALAIIINNYYFTTTERTRRGSDLDVCHLVRVLKRRCISYILVQDCNRQELEQIVEYVERKDLSPIKLLMLFLMSHGGKGDVFFTLDGQVNISEVVSRLEANPSLKDAEKLVLVNACRGDIDLDYADYREIENTQSSIVDRRQRLGTNTAIMYSVPIGVQSIRLPHQGSPFIRLLCHHLVNMSSADDVRSLESKINHDLSRIDYYDGLNKCCDLLEGDSTQRHEIVSEPIPAVNMLQLLRSIQLDFPLRGVTCDATLPSRYLFICGVLKRASFRKKYFANDLEEDDCKVDNVKVYRRECSIENYNILSFD